MTTDARGPCRSRCSPSGLANGPGAFAASPFPDKNLEAAVRAVLQHDPKAELTDEKLLNVYVLEAPGKEIKDLTGLEKCKNLALAEALQEQVDGHQAAQGPDQHPVARPRRQRDRRHRAPRRSDEAAIPRDSQTTRSPTSSRWPA